MSISFYNKLVIGSLSIFENILINLVKEFPLFLADFLCFTTTLKGWQDRCKKRKVKREKTQKDYDNSKVTCAKVQNRE